MPVTVHEYLVADVPHLRLSPLSHLLSPPVEVLCVSYRQHDNGILAVAHPELTYGILPGPCFYTPHTVPVGDLLLQSVRSTSLVGA